MQSEGIARRLHAKSNWMEPHLEKVGPPTFIAFQAQCCISPQLPLKYEEQKKRDKQKEEGEKFSRKQK